MGLKVIQRNTRKFLELRFWGWWKLYNKVRAEGQASQNRCSPWAGSLSPRQTEVPLGGGKPWEAGGSLKMRVPWRRRSLASFQTGANSSLRKIIVCLPTFHLIPQNKIHLEWRGVLTPLQKVGLVVSASTLGVEASSVPLAKSLASELE